MRGNAGRWKGWWETGRWSCLVPPLPTDLGNRHRTAIITLPLDDGFGRYTDISIRACIETFQVCANIPLRDWLSCSIRVSRSQTFRRKLQTRHTRTSRQSSECWSHQLMRTGNRAGGIKVNKLGGHSRRLTPAHSSFQIEWSITR
jgi:hypothetical protein